MSLGIYGYMDKNDNSIVYVGKDSNLEINKRHYDHLSPSKYKAQPFNRILQNNPNRYVYKRLYVCPPHLDEIDLNGLEMQYIKALNPKFNFTEGGDGSKYWLGKSFSKEHKKSIGEANRNDFPTIIKYGTQNGKQRYAINYHNTCFKRSVDKEKLESYLEENYDNIINGIK